MKWKTWILALGVFIAVCLLADWGVTRGLRNPLSDVDRIKHLYAENGDEIPIFGTSKAHYHYCPKDMGLNAFNYGIDGASYEITDVLLQIELAKSKTTPVIIELQHRDTGLLTDPGKFIPFVSDPRFRQLLDRYHAMQWRYYIPGIRFFGHYDSFLKDYVWLRMGMTKVTNGYSEVANPIQFNRAKMDQYIKERLAYTNGYFQDEDQNRRLFTQIKEHPQRLFFVVISPYHSSYFVRFQNTDKFDAFKTKLSELPNVVLLDWGQLNYPDESFEDTLHMQRLATTRFSRELGEKVTQVLHDRTQQASAKSPEVK